MSGKTVNVKISNIAYCGLYCEACPGYAKGKCPGCAGNEKATWCGIRKCNISNNYKSCADCTKYADPAECRDFNNLISRVIGFIFRSNRRGSIVYIKKNGYDSYASFMASEGRMSIKR